MKIICIIHKFHVTFFLQFLSLISIFPFVFPEFVYFCFKEDRSVSEEHAWD